MATTIADRVYDITEQQFGLSRDKLNPATRFHEDLGGDSLDCVEFCMELEEEFDITVPDEVVESTKTLGNMIKYVEKQIEEPKPA